MAKHEVVIHENTSATKETAPYLGNYVAKETIREDGFVGEIAKKSGLSAIQAQAILDGSFEALEALEDEALVRIHTDIGTIAGVITGSFETADAAFDPEKNAFNLALYLDDGLKLSLADATVTIIADENLTKLRVDNVMDLGTPRPYNLIHGQKVFRVAGYNMELADEGAEVYLQNAAGATFPVVVDEVVSKQLFKGHSASLLEAGDYKIFVKSRAGEAEGPLQTAFHRVKYLKIGPMITAVQAEGLPAGQVKVNTQTHVTSRNITEITKAEIAFTDPDGAPDKVTLDPTNVTAQGFDFKFLGGPAKEAVNNPKLVVETPDGTAEFPVVYV